MKSKTRLDSVVFQLTPTRTRCDLYIIANDKKEKIASGLLNPFIAHLKTAQDQIAEGGYSVLLEPEAGSNATWFTKCTVESFVRFVSTPEILERVYTIESEILQIEEAIAIQGNNDILIEDQHVKPVASNEGNKPAYEADEEKAIVLYKPGAHETTRSSDKEGNSKVQLLNVLETRKTVLKKEQGMAFARAVAAGFETEHVANLLSFAESFGASRLMSACLRFIDLWKQKHESGQWVEIAAEDAMSTKSDYSAMNASGIVLSSMTSIHNEPRSEATPETKEKAGSDPNAAGQHEYHTGQFPHPVFPHWPMHSSPGGIPVYQAYPVQGLPYYQHYPGSGPYYPPPYPPMEDPHFSGGQRTEQKRQSMDNRYTESESVNEEGSFDSERQKNAGKSGKKKSGKVVIRNINFINSKRQNSSEDESESASDTDTDDETASDTHKRRLRSPKRKGNRKESESETLNGKETDSSHWQAFQSYLLKGAAEDGRSANEDMFATETDPQKKRRQKTNADDPLAHVERDDDGEGHRIDMQSYEKNGRKIVSRNRNDDFMVGGREQANVRNSSDPMACNGFEGVTANLDGHGLHGINDEAIMVSLRSTSGVNDNRITIDMDYELPSSSQNPENKSNRIHDQVNFEPHDLSLMPERGLEKRSIGYDPALDYEMQLAEDAALREKKSKEALTDVKKASKSAEKHQQSKTNQGASDKKLVGPTRKGKPSKMNPLEDARARAEKLRSYKADLQKMKKEQQDAEHKRLEALKMERQKRIAARANSMASQPTMPTRKLLPSKLSPMSHRGSKFTDSEPGSSSPLQRSKITTSLGSGNSKKPSTSSKTVDGSHSAGNRLTRSLSSMSDTKKEINSVTPDSKASMARIRRLSEPKKINGHTTTTTTSFKARSAEPVSKPKLSNGPESKKISAIMNLDQSKAATLPELKMKTSRVPSNLSQKISAAKETVVKVKEDKHVAVSEVKLNLNDRLLDRSDADDNPVIDKTVMLEHKQPSITSANAGRVTKEFDSNHGTGKHIEEDSAAILESMKIVDKGTISVQPQQHHSSCEVRKGSVEDLAENPGTSSDDKMYQAPYARVSSFEDPSTRNSEYAKAPPTNFGMASVGGGVEKAYISDFNNLKLEKIPEVLEKPQVKEAKGFRRLLKLGKKSHSPSDTANGHGSEPDNVNLNDAASSEAVHTLKTLISEDHTPTHGHTSQKSSRHFSLLSPFRAKTSEKKGTA